MDSCKRCSLSLNLSFINPVWINNNYIVDTLNPLYFGIIIDPHCLPKDIEILCNEYVGI